MNKSTMTNPTAGRGGGGRNHKRRGGRGRGGRGRGGKEGERGKPAAKKDGAAVPKKPRKSKVAAGKSLNENRSPQDPKPPTPSQSFSKNVDDLKKVLGVGVDTLVRSSISSSGDNNNAGAKGKDTPLPLDNANANAKKTDSLPNGTVDVPQSEKKSMQQKLKEAREQAAAAKEKKKSKKSKKHEKWLKEQQQQQEERAKLWADKVKSDEKTFYLISDLIMTEFTRVNKGVEINDEIQKVIADKSEEAQDTMYGSSIKCRVTLDGLDRKDLNGRKGSIRHWDEDKGRFCVGLDTKKSRDCDVHFFKPENLQMDPSAQSSKSDKKFAANFFVVIKAHATEGHDVGCQFALEKGDIIKLESAHSRSNGLQEFREERDALDQRLMKEREEQLKEDERLEKERKEEQKRREELRAKKKAEKALKEEKERREREEAFKMRQQQAQMEWERKQAEMRRELEMEIHEIRKAMRKAHIAQFVEEVYAKFFHQFVEHGGGQKDFEEFKKDTKEVMIQKICGDCTTIDPSEVNEIIEEEQKRREEEFKGVLLEERLEEDKKHAEILGVSHDVDKRTLQKAYRKLALKYHPDKWSANNSHGKSKEEAEEYFKAISNSYDYLMANFDD